MGIILLFKLIFKLVKTAITLAIILLILMSTNAFAKGLLTPQPKEYSVITSDEITLGDVFEGVTDNKDFYLAPAPEMGKIRVITLKELQQISKVLHLDWEPENKAYRTVVKRSAATVKKSDIEQKLTKALKAKITTHEFEIALLNKHVKINVAEENSNKLLVENLNFNPAKMIATATISSADSATKKQVKASVHYITKVPVLSATMRRGDIISSDDISYIKVRADDIPASMMVNEENLIGKTPRNNIAALAPIHFSDLRMPTLVKKGDIVVMKLANKNISLTTQGHAIQKGKKGDVVRVENLSSKQVITAIVTGEREVTVTTPNTGIISQL